MTYASNARAATVGLDIVKIDNRDYVSVDSIKSFYAFTTLARKGNSLILEIPKKRRMNLTIGSRECLMNEVKFVFTHPVTLSGGKAFISRIDFAKLVDPVLRPSFIKDAGNFSTIILDPGHGGANEGATNSLGSEKTYNLRVAAMTKIQLEKRGFKVVMTRESDRYLSLQERVNLANARTENALFISIHFNAGGPEARGIETFTLSPAGVSHYGRDTIASDFMERAGNEHDSANVALATAVHGSVLRKLGTNTFDRGIKRARFSVLSGVKHPAILFEGGFMSHHHEARLIHNERYQKAIAGGIVEAILKYREALKPQVTVTR
jgi:N-acetylmuramoyl-L-alanine amidase